MRIGRHLPALAALVLAQAAAAQSLPPEPTIESATAALVEDAAEYARQHHVSVAEGLRRLVAQQDSVAATDRLRAQYRDRLAGIVLQHEPVFAIVVLLTGDEPVPDEAIVVGGATLPVLFRTGAAATHDQLLAAIEQHQSELTSALPDAPGLGIDERTGAVVLLVRPHETRLDGASVLAARLTALTGVPVTLMSWLDADRDLALPGGSRLVGVNPATNRRSVCTGGFVVTDGARTGIATAAHCPDELNAIDPDGTATPLTMIGAWGARYQDVQIHVGPEAFAPLFYADTARTRARALTSWRNRAATRVGDFVCHRGERSGYSCADVAFVDFAPPGDLCAGPCPPSWVAVKGPDCRGGDSGGPVFSGTVAFGLVKGASYTVDGTCRLYYYMSTDYLPPGWTLLHR